MRFAVIKKRMLEKVLTSLLKLARLYGVVYIFKFSREMVESNVVSV